MIDQTIHELIDWLINYRSPQLQEAKESRSSLVNLRDRCDEQELDDRKSAFHRRTAERSVDIILRLGGIYVKLGQVISTLGAGIIEDTYITALRPLQDGVPPRSLEAVSAIIEADELRQTIWRGGCGRGC